MNQINMGSNKTFWNNCIKETLKYITNFQFPVRFYEFKNTNIPKESRTHSQYLFKVLRESEKLSLIIINYL